MLKSRLCFQRWKKNLRIFRCLIYASGWNRKRNEGIFVNIIYWYVLLIIRDHYLLTSIGQNSLQIKKRITYYKTQYLYVLNAIVNQIYYREEVQKKLLEKNIPTWSIFQKKLFTIYGKVSLSLNLKKLKNKNALLKIILFKQLM